MTAAFFRRFWEQYLREQQPLVACGAPYVDDRILREQRNSQIVAVFQAIDESSGGWVSPGEYTEQVLSLPVSLPAKVAEVRAAHSELGCASCHQTGLWSVFDTFSRFVLRAERHGFHGNTDECFLHHVIALDLAFGEKEESTRSVSQRVAALIAGTASLSFEMWLKRVKTLYEIRSRYVHSGDSVGEEAVQSARTVTREVAWALIRSMRWINNTRPQLTADAWLSKLDYVVGCERSGEPASQESLALIGRESAARA